MKAAPFEYLRPGTLDAALAALDHPDAKIIAGGQSLVPMMAFRLAAPARLVDLGAVPGLSGVTERQDGGVSIGALVTHAQALADPVLAARYPVIAQALARVAHIAIRNRGTLGGSLCHADPSAEWPVLARLLDGVMELAGPEGVREVPAADFFDAPLATAVNDGEVLTALHLPPLPPGSVMAFDEVSQRAGDFAIVAAGVVLEVDGDRIASARLALGGVGDTPVRLTALEESLAGLPARAGALSDALTNAATGLEPPDDPQASAAFRLHLVPRLLARVAAAALADGPAPDAHPLPDRQTLAPRETATDIATITLTVNGEPVQANVPARLLASDFLRDHLGLTGTHVGCEHGVCGACTISVDGRTARSCLTFAVQLEGATVETVEALGLPRALHPIQDAFRRHHALQCGFCTPGILMTVREMLDTLPLRDDDEIRDALSGNLCRCTGYDHIVRAVRDLADARDATP